MKKTKTEIYPLKKLFTAEHEQLLRASLLQGDEALKSWEQFSRPLSPQEIEAEFEQAAYTLLPLFFRNLEKHGRSELLPAKYRGVYRHTWTKNQILLHSAASAIKKMNECGIKVMIFKGASIATTHYCDMGVRYMKDVDIIVKPENLNDALRILEESGWNRVSDYSFAKEFENKEGARIDVHWFANEKNWENAIAVSLDDISVPALSPTDLLHFMQEPKAWNLRWVSDMFVLVNSTAFPVDWNTVIERSKRQNRCLALRIGLHYLMETLGTSAPKTVLKELDALEISIDERVCLVLNTSPFIGNGRSRFRKALDIWSQFYRGMRSENWFTKISGFRVYLMYRWHVKKWWKLPMAAVNKLLKKKTPN